jgi:hypothetical protein
MESSVCSKPRRPQQVQVTSGLPSLEAITDVPTTADLT